jgi:hypothetical protein
MSRKLISLGRALFAAGGAVSFVLLLGVLYLWVRSYFIAELIYFPKVAAPEEFASPMPNKPERWDYQWNLSTGAGKVQIVRRNLGVKEGTEPRIEHLRPDDPRVFTDLKAQDPLDVDWRIAGVKYFHSDRRYFSVPPVKYWVWGFQIVTVPYWLLALMTAILPAIVGVRLARSMRQRGRLRAGMCQQCGYDLRGGGGICPECGTKFETTSAVARR